MEHIITKGEFDTILSDYPEYTENTTTYCGKECIEYKNTEGEIVVKKFTSDIEEGVTYIGV